MNRKELQKLFGETVRSDDSDTKAYERLAAAVVETYDFDASFCEHIGNRSKRVLETTGVAFDGTKFDVAMARAFIADEIGYSSWNDLIDAVANGAINGQPILFRYAVAALWRGDFTALDQTLSGRDAFHNAIVTWFQKGYFTDEPETFAEAFAAACWLGHVKTVVYLLDKGVDPYAGMRTGLSGFHWAASSGKADVIRLLVERKLPTEIKGMYDNTVLGQALYSAINEHTPYHGELIEALIEGGAHVWPETLEWWEEQNVPDAETKRRVGEVLRRHREFHARISLAERKVNDAEADGSKRVIADSLKALGNLMRRPPFLREKANEVYERAANLYQDIGLPIEEAWVKRHIGINREYAGQLEEAEKYYDEALALYREHSTLDDLDYANAVRYPAVVKERLGKKDESAKLWEEAHDRYARVHPDGLGEGVAEAAAWLTILAIEKGDPPLARRWFEKANAASEASSDPDTHKFIAEIRSRFELS